MSCQGSDTATRHGDYDIRIVVSPAHLPEEREGGRHWFLYRIVIFNRGQSAVRLLSRYWRITDGEQHVREVRGDGVVGEQPVIAEGESHIYTSFVDFETSVGYMEGHFVMQAPDGDRFRANIDVFSLSVSRYQ